jgi:hypothetical protein
VGLREPVREPVGLRDTEGDCEPVPARGVGVLAAGPGLPLPLGEGVPLGLELGLWLAETEGESVAEAQWVELGVEERQSVAEALLLGALGVRSAEGLRETELVRVLEVQPEREREGLREREGDAVAEEEALHVPTQTA